MSQPPYPPEQPPSPEQPPVPPQQPYQSQHGYPPPQAPTPPQQGYPSQQGYASQQGYPPQQGYPSQQPYPGQQQYGPPGGYPGDVAPVARRSTLRLGVVGLVLAVIGAALLVVSFTAVNWFRSSSDSTFGGSTKFGEVHKHLGTIKAESQGLADGTWIAKAYFGWLGWVLLAAVVVLAILGNLPARGISGLGRGLGLLVGLAGIGLTFWAIKLLSLSSSLIAQVPSSERAQLEDINSYSFYWHHVSIGFWLAVAGFAVAGIGAVLGPRRARV